MKACHAAILCEARTRPASKAPLEAHRAYIDVRVILEATDTMGWSPLEACRRESVPYDSAGQGPGVDRVMYTIYLNP